jgi:hypothetical protein
MNTILAEEYIDRCSGKTAERLAFRRQFEDASHKPNFRTR